LQNAASGHETLNRETHTAVGAIVLSDVPFGRETYVLGTMVGLRRTPLGVLLGRRKPQARIPILSC